MPLNVIDLERQVEELSERVVVTKLVFRDVFVYVDSDELLDRVVDDVLRGWRQRDPGAPADLDGPKGYWNSYANQIEFAPVGSGNQYRAEFCPEGAGSFEDHEYYESVWLAHIAGLPVGGGTGAFDNDAGTCAQRAG